MKDSNASPGQPINSGEVITLIDRSVQALLMRGQEYAPRGHTDFYDLLADLYASATLRWLPIGGLGRECEPHRKIVGWNPHATNSLKLFRWSVMNGLGPQCNNFDSTQRPYKNGRRSTKTSRAGPVSSRTGHAIALNSASVRACASTETSCDSVVIQQNVRSSFCNH